MHTLWVLGTFFSFLELVTASYHSHSCTFNSVLVFPNKTWDFFSARHYTECLYPLANWIVTPQWDVGPAIICILHRRSWASWIEAKFSPLQWGRVLKLCLADSRKRPPEPWPSYLPVESPIPESTWTWLFGAMAVPTSSDITERTTEDQNLTKDVLCPSRPGLPLTFCKITSGGISWVIIVDCLVHIRTNNCFWNIITSTLAVE